MEKLIFAYSYITGAVAAPKRDEKGATAVEYGLLVALIAAVIIAAVVLLGDNITGGFDTVNEKIGGTEGTGAADADA